MSETRSTATTFEREGRVRLGAFLVLLGAALFAVSGLLVKSVGESVPTAAVVFWRSAFGALLLAPLAVRRRRRWFVAANLPLIALRSVTVLASLWCYYRAVTLLPLATAVLLISSAPLFVPVLGRLLFGFALDRTSVLATVAGLVGVTFVLEPGSAVPLPGALLGLAAGLSGAAGAVLVWRMPAAEDAGRIAFFLAAFCALASLPFALAGTEWPTAGELRLLALLGLSSTLAHVLFSRACLVAPADRVMPFDYATVVFAALAGWWLHGETLDAGFALGAALIAGAGAIALRASGRASTRR